jgi:hypothetical protein
MTHSYYRNDTSLDDVYSNTNESQTLSPMKSLLKWLRKLTKCFRVKGKGKREFECDATEGDALCI